MIESAGRVADGLLAHTMCSPRYLQEVARPAVERGAAARRRDPGGVVIATYALAWPPTTRSGAPRGGGDDRLLRHRQVLRRLFEHCGFGAEAEAIQGAFAARDVDAMLGAVTEAMVDEFAVAGTPAEGARRAAALRRHRRQVVLSPPSFRITPQRAAELLAALTEHCAPAG